MNSSSISEKVLDSELICLVKKGDTKVKDVTFNL